MVEVVVKVFALKKTINKMSSDVISPKTSGWPLLRSDVADRVAVDVDVRMQFP